MSMVTNPGEGGLDAALEVGPTPEPQPEPEPEPEPEPIQTLDWSSTFVTLYQANYLPMVRLAYLMTGSNSSAEEIVQEAFVRVRYAVNRVDNPAAYLRTAVVNGCHNQHRRDEVERRHRPALAHTADPGDPDHLMDALAGLPERQRAVLVLRYYGGFSEAEIAATLGCRQGTVKSTSSRALAHLRKVIEQ